MAKLGKMKEDVALYIAYRQNINLTREDHRIHKIQQRSAEQNQAELDSLKKQKSGLKKCQRNRLARLQENINVKT